MPDAFDPKERPTRPDWGVYCPACKGEGSRHVKLPSGTRVLRICKFCQGRKRVSREQGLRIDAELQSSGDED